jgi:hypothetical protein
MADRAGQWARQGGLLAGPRAGKSLLSFFFPSPFLFLFLFSVLIYSNLNSNVFLQVLTWEPLRVLLGYISALYLMGETWVCSISYLHV